MSDFIVRHASNGMYLANGDFESTRTEAYRFSGIEEAALVTFLDGFFARETYEILDYQNLIEFNHTHILADKTCCVAPSVPSSSVWAADDVRVDGRESNIVRLRGPRMSTATLVFAWHYLTPGPKELICGVCQVTMIMETPTPRKLPVVNTYMADQGSLEDIEATLNAYINDELGSFHAGLSRR